MLTMGTLLLSLTTAFAPNCSHVDRRYHDACEAASVLEDVYFRGGLDFPAYKGSDLWRVGEALQATVDYAAYSGDTSTFEAIVETIHKRRPWYMIEVLADGSWDDSSWWVLAYIRAHEVFGSSSTNYIGDARRVFDHVWEKAHSTETCGGGVWWSSKNSYKNAVTNELIIACAARLYLAGQGDEYLHIASQQWSWFERSGMMNEQGLINDGLNIDSANLSHCTNNGGETWTYNQGVIIGAAAALFKATNTTSYVEYASKLAKAVLASSLVDARGILTESCGDACNEDGKQFKGIFVRNLRYLIDTSALSQEDRDRFCGFLAINAASMLANDKTSDGRFGGFWQGPVDTSSNKNDFTNTTDATTQTSALDLLLAQCA